MLLKELFIISILISFFIFTTHSSHTQCLPHEKKLLLQLKNELIFNSSLSTKLVQWNQTDDCWKWYGVECDVGHIVSLQLDHQEICGGIGDSSSLFRLKHLEKLNLAYNYFNSTQRLIPRGSVDVLSLRKLVSLDISSYANYWVFELFDWRFIEPLKLEYPNLEMLVQNLTGLRELYLDYVMKIWRCLSNITSSYERRKWSHIISSYLPNLTSLSLVECDLYGSLSKSFWKLYSLSLLQLDYNNLSRVLFGNSIPF